MKVSEQRLREAREARKARQARQAWQARKKLAAGRRNAKGVRNAGIGITAGGVAALTVGVVVAVTATDLRTGLLAAAMGGAVGGIGIMIGIIMWTVGGVHLSLDRAGEAWKSKRRTWKRTGLALIVTGAGVAAVGYGLVWANARRPNLQSALTTTGSTLVAVGQLTALAVGLPMWIAANAATSRTPPPPPARTSSYVTLSPSLPPLDLQHEGALVRRLTLGTPRPAIFTATFTF